jgi:hypothetical protein
MDQLTPTTIRVTSGLGAAGEKAVGVHRGIITATPGRRMKFAPAHIEDLADRVGIRLTARTVHTGDRGAVGQVVRHGPSRGAIAVTRPGPRWNPQAFAI